MVLASGHLSSRWGQVHRMWAGVCCSISCPHGAVSNSPGNFRFCLVDQCPLLRWDFVVGSHLLSQWMFCSGPVCTTR